MIEKIILFCKAFVTNFISSVKRFPEPLLLSTSVVIILCVINHMSSTLASETLELLHRLSLILGLGIPVSLSIKVFFERKPILKSSYKAILYGIAIMGLFLYYTFILGNMEIIPMIRYTAVSIAFYCMFLFIPYFYRKENYELYIINLVTKFLITYLYSLILYAGLAALIGTINTLFSLEISYKIYFDMGLIVIGVFAPIFFLGDLPKNHQELTLSSYPKVIKILMLYIVMPLITAYSITLYAYFAKILITMQWPEGIVSNLVLWYSFISVVVIFAIYPLREGNRWAKSFSQWFPIIVIPLLAMMFVALSIRINAYGITENRYFSFITGLWILCCMIYLIVVKKVRTILLPVSVAIVALLVVTGPWNCFSVSTASQSARFEHILNKYDLLEAGKITKISKEISDGDKQEISSILAYFNRYKKLSELKALPRDFKMEQMQTVFGFARTGQSAMYFNHRIKEQNNAVDIRGFDYYFDVLAKDVTIQKDEIPVSIAYTGNNGEVQIMRLGQLIYSGNINDIALKIHYANKNNASLNNEDMMITDQNENVKVVYIIKSISGINDNEGSTIKSVVFSLLIKLK